MGTEPSQEVCVSLSVSFGEGGWGWELYPTLHLYHHNDSASDESLYNARLIVRGKVKSQLPINPQLVSALAFVKLQMTFFISMYVKCVMFVHLDVREVCYVCSSRCR